MTSAAIRQLFLDYFQKHGHERVPSSSLVPGNDPTLLFTNAGMVPFKEIFTGHESRSYKRAVSSQRCVRAGGKHNDLENVGYTARHHTFFEMLGNFSFGDYFKHEAIHYAWEFLTRECALPPEKLWVTVYEKDDEAAEIWLNDIGVDPARFGRLGPEDNFWSMGDTGPCGPCSEIFYDHGAGIAGGPPGSPDAEGDRYVEIWNLVFMQYNRDNSGEMTPLPHPSVDTGMGLERLAAVMQGVHSNYDIDLFKNLIKAAARIAGTKDTQHASLRVIVDHIRSCAFLIVDGIIPSNEGRGYVLRRIIRRAIRHGYMLGIKDVFFYRLVAPLVTEMGDAYPELAKAAAQAEQVLKQEEVRFAETLEQGMQILEQAIAKLDGDVIAGDTVFRLYDTYGFPADLTADIARERGLTLDMDGFEQEMTAQRERARSASQFGRDYTKELKVTAESAFTGYDHIAEQSRIVALYGANNNPVNSLEAGEPGFVVLDKTPFYAESGGQVGDSGELRINKETRFVVSDTQKASNVNVLVGEMESGVLRTGDVVTSRVNDTDRQSTELNHSATHLLHAALREILGKHVTQKGSLVDPHRLRFDFAHFEAMTPQQIEQVEQRVNEQIRANHTVETNLMDYDEALETGAMALFGEKYSEQVRVLRMGDFSIELCGGTHVKQSGDIGLFKMISESGIASGVRRIEALTGQCALEWVEQDDRQLHQLAGLVKASRDNVLDKVQQVLTHNRQLEKALDALKSKMASNAGGDLAGKAQEMCGSKVLAAKLDGVDAKSLRHTLDQLKDKLDSGIIVLAAVSGNKVSLVAGVSKDRTDQIKASDLVNFVAQQVGGKGGGRADMAQAGGDNPAALDGALAAVPEWVRQTLEGRDET